MKNRKKTFLILLFIVCLLIGVLYYQSTSVDRKRSEMPILIDGDTTFTHIQDINCYLLLGLDSYGEIEEPVNYTDGARADFIVLLMINHEDETWQLFNIDRDTLVTMETYDENGNSEGPVYQQICLTHLFGDSIKENNENTADAVSELLWNEPIDGIYAMNIGGIGELNDLVGGVEMTLDDDFSDAYADMTEGATVTLDAERAYAYLVLRQTVDDGTNVSRNIRQQKYISALIAQLKESVASDKSLVFKLYTSLRKYSKTDISLLNFIKIARCVMRYEHLDTISLEGTHQIEYEIGDVNQEEPHTTFRIDEQSLKERIVNLFYEISK